ncbi:ATP-binding cassette domain-containing protein [Desulfosporosinus sp. PR]|uniref:ABC transporter ATP-binding protein n=1 Tax=Candidatus Desulfosporosinus nitrosoreducens TaxID=3401928 RepID=UPI0027F1BBF6|nr:ATP-binding cassette domain-containing protein [Desulfosporosinus sp. PR]MDQ7094891.1 ATP-binding cassette domain-containing protein [Desulfosporosinus sp. PR]
MELFQIENLTFSYPGETGKALDQINLTVNQGEFLLLCGPSGCGKTSLLRLLKREIAPHGLQSGEIRYCGTAQTQLSDRAAAAEIGFVMQNPEQQVVTDKVWHELAYGLENMGVSHAEIRRRVGEIACFFGINRWFERKTSELSGGQKQLLTLASILVMQPKVLILDEPTSQLDPIGAAEFIFTLYKLNRDLGLTIILAEHRLEEVFALSDKVAVMDQGRILLADTPARVGETLRRAAEGRRMLLGMPSAVRIFTALDSRGQCPLTVKEGRLFLEDHYQNAISRLPVEQAPPANGGEQNSVYLKEVWFRYERQLPDVLKGTTFKAARGETLAILGENGSGKTTLLRLIAGQNRAYRGRVEINGQKIQRYGGKELYRHNLALLPQDPQTVFLKSSVEEDFAELCSAMDYKPREAAAMIRRNAALLEIDHLLKKHPYDLSGGEQQRAALAKILLLQPQILLLDEPTKGIDAYAKNTLKDILNELKSQGLTVIMATHDVEFAAIAADCCALLFEGEIIGADSPRNFFSANTFYTTAASRISRTLYENAVTVEDVVRLCRQNGELPSSGGD